MVNCMTAPCPFYLYDKENHRHYCQLMKHNMNILTNPIFCRPLIDYQKNHYGK